MRKVNSDSKCLFIKAKEEKQTERKKKNVQRKKRHLMTVRQLPDYKSWEETRRPQRGKCSRRGQNEKKTTKTKKKTSTCVFGADTIMSRFSI